MSMTIDRLSKDESLARRHYYEGVTWPGELVVTRRAFDFQTGKVRRGWLWMERRRAVLAWLRSWRPRIRLQIRVMLFPKTQRRLEALEAAVACLERRLDWLRDETHPAWHKR